MSQKKKNETSSVWNHFSKKPSEKSEKIAICNICEAELCYQSTSNNLKKHLSRKHPFVKLLVKKCDEKEGLDYQMVSFLDDTIKYQLTTTDIKKNIDEQKQQEEEMLPSPVPSLNLNDMDSPTITNNQKKEKNVDLTIVGALNRINAPVDSRPATGQINPTCITISSLLAKMPLKERVPLEIELLKKAYEGAKNYL